VIINNGYLGMVRQWQELFYDKRYSHTFIKGSVDFVKLAEAYGALGLRAERPSEVRPQSRGNQIGQADSNRRHCRMRGKCLPYGACRAAINEILDLEEQ